MLRLAELKKYAFKRRLKNLEFIRKDYVQDIILFLIYSQIYPFAVFKGGTAIWKILKGERFSEDIDLELDKKIKIGNMLLDGLNNWGFNSELLKEKISESAYYMKLKLNAKNFGTVFMSIEATYRPRRGEIGSIISPYPDIPNFEVYFLSPLQIAEEKLNAIINRNKSRDVFDLYLLLRNFGFTLKYSNIDELRNKIEEKRSTWTNLKYFVVTTLPKFDYVMTYILKRIKNVKEQD